jgi:DNA helicase HerA-like ATPase
LPFWFKHFDENDINDEYQEYGANDAYHIGIFGKTGSGKTVTAAMVLLGYAKNKHNISILVLDPQSQFYSDIKVLPTKDAKMEDYVKKAGMKYEKYKILTDIYLPGKSYDLFTEFLSQNDFIKDTFRILTQDKRELMQDSIEQYLFEEKINLNDSVPPISLLKKMLTRFVSEKNEEEEQVGASKYLTNVYRGASYLREMKSKITSIMNNLSNYEKIINSWKNSLVYFYKTKKDNTEKLSIDEIIKKTVFENGNFIVLDISQEQGGIENDNLQSLFIKVIEQKIINKGAELIILDSTLLLTNI